jgi:dipeptidyl aminopeptidase/acylaminoacyl peptidase
VISLFKNVSAAVGLMLLAAMAFASTETVTRGSGLSADIASDGRVTIDLDGGIWLVPRQGGTAKPISHGADSARHPRWSPDGSSIAFAAVADGLTDIRVYDIQTGRVRNLGNDGTAEFFPAWHPDGERIVFSSARSGSGLDLWEVDLPTGLQWRLSDRAGDETEAAWTEDGRNLVYIHHIAGQWSLILRRHGEPEETLLVSAEPIAAPSWRPDGSLITFLRAAGSERVIDMVILSSPRLIRRYADGEAFEPAPVSWLDKDNMVYTADGRIRQRQFDDWNSSPLPFRARRQVQPQTTTPVRRQLPRIDEPRGRLVVHAARLFDGVRSGYTHNSDIVIESGRIVAVEPHQDRDGVAVINLGDLSVLPGYIDSDAALKPSADAGYGAALLTTGVTTIVAQSDDAAHLNERWSAKESPGPRLLDAAVWRGNAATAIADAATPGIDELFAARQASLFAAVKPDARRFAQLSAGTAGATTLRLGSRDNGLPAGLALHAEFRARAAVGLKPEQILRAAGVNAAAALGADPYLGRIAVGAVADLVFVDGDPLADIDDALNIVAVVRNGRFYSVVGLLERAAAGMNGE